MFKHVRHESERLAGPDATNGEHVSNRAHAGKQRCQEVAIRRGWYVSWLNKALLVSALFSLLPPQVFRLHSPRDVDLPGRGNASV